MVLILLKIKMITAIVLCQQLKAFRNKDYYVEYEYLVTNYLKAKEICLSRKMRLVALTRKDLFQFLVEEIRRNIKPSKYDVMQCKCNFRSCVKTVRSGYNRRVPMRLTGLVEQSKS